MTERGVFANAYKEPDMNEILKIGSRVWARLANGCPQTADTVTDIWIRNGVTFVEVKLDARQYQTEQCVVTGVSNISLAPDTVEAKTLTLSVLNWQFIIEALPDGPDDRLSDALAKIRPAAFDREDLLDLIHSGDRS